MGAPLEKGPFVALLLPLLAACATAPAPVTKPAGDENSPFEVAARPVFSGCEPSPEGSSGRLYACGAVDAWIINMGDIDLDGAMEVGRASARQVMKEQLRAAKEELTLAGRPWAATRVSSCAQAGASCETGYLVAVKGPQGITRFLGCAARGSPPSPGDLERCRRMLDYFARSGTPDDVALTTLQEELQAPPPKLLARELDVPPGCRVMEATADSGLIDCETSMFSWAVVERDADFQRGLELFSGAMKKRLPKVTRETRVGCTLEKLPAECAHLEGEASDTRVHVFVGKATLPGTQGLLATCFFTEEFPEFAPVCNGVFALPR